MASPSAVSLPSGILLTLVRGFFRWRYRKIRALRQKALGDTGASLLVVQHPPGLLAALLVVAALDRPVHFLLESKFLEGGWRAWGARKLGVIPVEAGPTTRHETLEAASVVLAQGGVLGVFRASHGAGGKGPAPLILNPAGLALQLEVRHSGESGLRIFPLHLFWPGEGSRAREVLLHLGTPLAAREYLPKSAEDVDSPTDRLTQALWEPAGGSPFRLHPDDVEDFFAELEDVLRADLREEWEARPNWKQRAEEFTLSEFLVKTVDEMNDGDPGRLVALQEHFGAYREAQRRGSLAQLEIEHGGAWLKSSLGRGWVWMEGVLGLPLAAYGAANHALAGAALSWTGSLKPQGEVDSGVWWFRRALVVLGCYALQVLLSAGLADRATTGTYALTLPLSGAYLWHYGAWVWPRLRVLLRARASEESKLREMRKELIDELNAAQEASAEALGLPR